MKRKLFVKQNDSTIANGVAGLQVVDIVGKEWEGETLMLTLYVRDVDGGLGGPYKIPQDETEIRFVEEKGNK